eukprot:4548131-Amphidinium_carterae.2
MQGLVRSVKPLLHATHLVRNSRPKTTGTRFKTSGCPVTCEFAQACPPFKVGSTMATHSRKKKRFEGCDVH